MQLMHFTYGFGTFIAPLLVAFFDYSFSFKILGFILLCIAYPFFSLTSPEKSNEDSNTLIGTNFLKGKEE